MLFLRNNKKCLIKQPIGLGDIFYLQKAARTLMSLGYEIIWPVRDDIIWVSEYIPDINFCKLSEDFPYKDIYYKYNK